jgi:hypothetical protein
MPCRARCGDNSWSLKRRHSSTTAGQGQGQGQNREDGVQWEVSGCKVRR